jgi:NAD-dependent dihydropyrimidine dehydrogenase PreA subunit
MEFSGFLLDRRNFMRFRYFYDGEDLKLDSEKCTGCGMYLEVCPHNVFRLENNKAFAFRKEYCMECGACSKNCPVGAINVKSGVGCASAIIRGFLSNSEPSCGCSNDKEKSNCCC